MITFENMTDEEINMEYLTKVEQLLQEKNIEVTYAKCKPDVNIKYVCSFCVSVRGRNVVISCGRHIDKPWSDEWYASYVEIDNNNQTLMIPYKCMIGTLKEMLTTLKEDLKE